MPYDTLWDSICRLAGENHESEIRLEDAIAGSAVTERVAVVEVRRFIEDGLIEGDGQTMRLTDRGRKACEEQNLKRRQT